MENDAYGRCTNTMLRAFGVHVKEKVLDGLGVIHHLTEAGYVLDPMAPGNGFRYDDYETTLNGEYRLGLKLGEFRKRFPVGCFYVGTRNHAMALIDGDLIDTQGGTNRRRVEFAYRVTT